MALFHLEVKIHGKKTKSGGPKSLDSIVAYRHRERIGNYNYKNKKDLIDSFILSPTEIEVEHNHKAMWKAIEKLEKRKDAQFCKEIIISLQHELSLEENIQNLKKLLNKHIISKGLIADVCIHNSKDNLHAHVLIPQRPIKRISFYRAMSKEMEKPIGLNMEYLFGNKLQENFYANGKKVNQIDELRKDWADICNSSFEKNHKNAQISHLSLKKQKSEALLGEDLKKASMLDREPSRHIFRNGMNEITFRQALKTRSEQKNNKIKENLDEYNRLQQLSQSITNVIAATAKYIKNSTMFISNFARRNAYTEIRENDVLSSNNIDGLKTARKNDSNEHQNNNGTQQSNNNTYVRQEVNEMINDIIKLAMKDKKKREENPNRSNKMR